MVGNVTHTVNNGTDSYRVITEIGRLNYGIPNVNSGTIIANNETATPTDNNDPCPSRYRKYWNVIVNSRTITEKIRIICVNSRTLFAVNA